MLQREGRGAALVPLLAVAFFASGFAALLYQVVWQRLLGLFAGSDAVTAAIVVGAFLAGIGLGSLAAGLLTDRITPRAAATGFALCEAGIAGFGLLSVPALHVWLPALVGHGLEGTQVFAACFVALLPPTFLMGMSLPLLSRAVVPRIEAAAGRIGLLYGLNTLGAGAGALIGGFLLVGTLGFDRAVLLGSVLNLAAGLLALPARSMVPDLPPAPRVRTSGGGLPLGWMALMFASGFLIVALEILWVRVLGVLGQTSAYSFALILGVFLVADGLGTVMGARLVARMGDLRRTFLLLQAGATIWTLATLAGFWAAAEWPAVAGALGVDAWRHSTGAMAALAAAALITVAPPSFLLGLSFPVVQRAVQDDLATVGSRVGFVQVANIMGNAGGGLFAGLVALHLWGSAGALKFLSFLALAMMVPLLLRRDRPAFAVAAALAAGAIAFPSNAAFWARLHRTFPTQQALVAEDRSGVVVLRLDGGNGAMFIQGHTQSRLPFLPIHVFLGALGPALHPAPRDVMVVGVGSGGTPYAAGWNPATEQVRAVELVGAVYDVLDTYRAQQPDSAPALMARDRRFSLVVGDGRKEVFAGGAQWDVIEADAILPQTSHSGMLYSVEFLDGVKDSLRPGGLFVQWAPTERVVAGFLQTFPHVVMIRPASILIGSDRPIPYDAEALAARFASPEFARWAEGAKVDPAAMAAMFSAPPRIWGPADARPAMAANTDLFPRDEYWLNNDVRGAEQLGGAGPTRTVLARRGQAGGGP